MRELTLKDVEIISHKVKYKGYFSIEGYKLRYKLFAGGWSEVVHREVFERGQAVGVLPYDPVLKKVVLIEQFRPGALKDEKSPWLLEIVAGIIEPDESLEVVARREAEEEAGLVVSSLMPIYKYWVTPGACTETVDLYYAPIDASQAGGIHGVQTEAEDIRVHVLDIEEAFQLLHTGMVTNALSIIALQWLELNWKTL